MDSAEITDDEAALYDRQIRLWGVEAQKRLRKANVLVAGLGGLGAEVTKNLVLAGIKSITLMDDKEVTELDSICQFLVSTDDVGKNRAESSKSHTQRLNPMVKVSVDTGSVTDKDEAFFKEFDVVCLTQHDQQTAIKINMICRKNGIQFFYGCIWGMYGFSFTDLKTHHYVEEVIKYEKKESGDEPPAKKKKRSEEQTTTMVKRVLDFPSLENAMSVKHGKSGTGLHKNTSHVFLLVHVLLRFQSEHGRPPLPKSRLTDVPELLSLRDSVLDSLGVDKSCLPDIFASMVYGELNPVCAVVGGVLGQEIIKAISASGAPLKNFFLFDGTDCSGVVESIGR